MRSADDSDSDPDEFFDCFENVKKDGEKTKLPYRDQPTGRKSKHGTSKFCSNSVYTNFNLGDLLLLTTGEPLFVPKTQEIAPRTEDQLEEHTELLLHLGTTPEGSALRASLQSASLLADMSAFKAANPGCIYSDFIRWYSPRDWIEEDGKDEFGQVKGN